LDFEFKKSQKFTTERKKKTLKRIGDFHEPLDSKCRVKPWVRAFLK
jgi:hypothetical protein